MWVSLSADGTDYHNVTTTYTTYLIKLYPCLESGLKGPAQIV